MLLNHDQIQAFDRDGFVLVPDMFSPLEIETLLATVGKDGPLDKVTFNVTDNAGRESKLAFWADIRKDIFGAVSSSPRVVDNARMLLREDVYHWHSKVSMKQPRTGGAWEWHQDYGYWYGDGCLYPRMVSCMIALDPATRENGCLKVIVGSHLLGRLDHGKVAGQVGADQARVEEVMKRLPVHYCEAPSGSALFFHGNTFHSSEANLSDKPRNAYLCCYNAWSNQPWGEAKGQGRAEPIVLSPDDAILRYAQGPAAA